MAPVLVAVVVLGVAGLWFIATFNRLIGLKNQVANGWKQIDVQLKRRHDLIPNLVETVKGAMSFERGTLEAVIAARNQAIGLLRGGGGAVPAARRSASWRRRRISCRARWASCSRSSRPTRN